MKSTPLKERLKAGENLLGSWSIMASASVCEILGSSGFDFQVLDFEHGVYDSGSLESCLRACQSAGCHALVRPAGFDPAVTQIALDLGAEGVIFPQVKSAGDVEKALALTRFAPKGERGFNPFTRSFGFGLSAGAPEDSIVRSVIVETRSAWEQIDQILAIEDLDMVYLGVYDMSVALGFPGQVGHPEIERFVTDVTKRARKAGKFVGAMSLKSTDAAKLVESGVQFVVQAVDSQLIASSAKALRDAFPSKGLK